MVEAICFDLDNTLIDRDAAHARWCAAILSRNGAVDNAAGLLANAMERDQGGYGDRIAYFDWFAKALETNKSGETLYREHQAEIADFVVANAEVKLAIAKIGARFPIAVVSNGRGATQRAKLRAAGLDGEFDQIIISGEVGFGKPDPRIFRCAAAALGRSLETTLFVGDDRERDIVGAGNVGMSTCLVRGRSGLGNPRVLTGRSLVVDGVADLIEAEFMITRPAIDGRQGSSPKHA